WDRTPYVEVDDETGATAYVEHHRTIADWVHLLAGHRFRITAMLEPEWPEENERLWGGWSRARGLVPPGTAIFGCDLD
ncbi:MAG: SAM-dependent methyltransferase, partial [Nocardioidaceae bacterium]|nr:SAM-dependent methyltransferase [Nocardioidaceae bacterium]